MGRGNLTFLAYWENNSTRKIVLRKKGGWGGWDKGEMSLAPIHEKFFLAQPSSDPLDAEFQFKQKTRQQKDENYYSSNAKFEFWRAAKLSSCKEINGSGTGPAWRGFSVPIPVLPLLSSNSTCGPGLAASTWQETAKLEGCGQEFLHFKICITLQSTWGNFCQGIFFCSSEYFF